MRIIVVCGAGASSTFAALRIRQAAAARGLGVDARASSLAHLADALADGDVLLVGAHLADQLDQLERAAAEASVPVVVLPADAAVADGGAALDLALAARAGAGS